MTVMSGNGSAAPRQERIPAVAAIAGVVGAVAASSCCLLPLALFGVGATGAWIGTLSSLSPYQPIFLAVTAVFLTAGFWTVYRKPAADCAPGSYCARPVSDLVVKSALWGSTVLVAAAAAFPFVAAYLFD